MTGLLDGPRATDAFLLRALLDPPWSLRIEDEAPLTLLALTRGEAWLTPDGASPLRIGAGDVALVRGPGHYVLADDPATAPQVIIHPGQRCTTVGGADLSESMGLGVRTWGNADHGGGACRMLVGTYESHSEIAERFVSALPAVAVVTADQQRSPLVDLLREELVRDEVAQELILNRLLDLLVIATARAWFERPDGDPPAWYLAGADPIVGPALQLMYNGPEHPWSVASLAAEVGVSRALFARRFSELMSVPPMAFLTEIRMSLAADLLRGGDDSVSRISARVGYTTPYAFSSAFKRVTGSSPSSYRNAS